MIVHDLNFVSIAGTPDKANAPPVVYTDAVLPFPLAKKRFKTISRRRRQIAQLDRGIQLTKFPKGNALDTSEAFYRFAFVKLLGIFRPKRLDHKLSLYRYALNGKQKARRSK